MICPRCGGKGNVKYVTFLGQHLDRWGTPTYAYTPLPRWEASIRWEACIQCGGNGIVHCCEGECEQPEKEIK
jgi:hypothetical protein